jgi:hypothetical protein
MRLFSSPSPEKVHFFFLERVFFLFFGEQRARCDVRDENDSTTQREARVCVKTNDDENV